jgi:hypothetical protein
LIRFPFGKVEGKQWIQGTMGDGLPPGCFVEATTQLPIWLVEQTGLKYIGTRMSLFVNWKCRNHLISDSQNAEPRQDPSATSLHPSIVHNLGQHLTWNTVACYEFYVGFIEILPRL